MGEIKIKAPPKEDTVTAILKSTFPPNIPKNQYNQKMSKKNTENNPLVTISIPSYKPDFFEQSLRSALGQTYQNIEIYVSDNCKTEDIFHICNKYPQVNYKRNQNMGSKNVIDSFFLGKGIYIKPLFDDDILHPFCVEYMVKAMQSDPDASLCFSSRSFINKHNIIIGNNIPFPENKKLDGEFIKKSIALNANNYIGEFSTILFQRKHIQGKNRYQLFDYNNESFIKGLTDVIFFIKLTSDSSAIYLKDTLSYFRNDFSVASNSHPLHNKDFTLAITNWMDILVNLHKNQEISDEEMVNTTQTITDITKFWIHSHPEIIRNFEEYLEYIRKILMKNTHP